MLLSKKGRLPINPAAAVKSPHEMRDLSCPSLPISSTSDVEKLLAIMPNALDTLKAIRYQSSAGNYMQFSKVHEQSRSRRATIAHLVQQVSHMGIRVEGSIGAFWWSENLTPAIATIAAELAIG